MTIRCALAFVFAAALGAQSPLLVSPEGDFLGNVNSNRFDPNSIANPYGTYGSKYSPNSINNPYGTYGSPYSSSGSRNQFGVGAPPAKPRIPKITFPSFGR